MRDSDADLRRRLRREIAHAAKLNEKMSTAAERSFFDWLARRLRDIRPRVRIRKRDVVAALAMLADRA